MKTVHPARSSLPFGGITVLLGRDSRQILPVITYGERDDSVSVSITRSRLWSSFHIFLLFRNIRLNKGNNADEIQELADFAQWVLDIGDGKVKPSPNDIPSSDKDQIAIPNRFCDITSENSVDNMIKVAYPDFIVKCRDPNYLSERAIHTPTNHTVGHINNMIVKKLPSETFFYFSVDTAEEFGGTEDDLQNVFLTEYLNSINISGML